MGFSWIFVGISVAYLFNIVNEPQITDLYFHNVLAIVKYGYFFVFIYLRNASFSHFELYELYVIAFKVHKVRTSQLC